MPQTPEPLPKDLKDPFAPVKSRTPKAGLAPQARSDAEILAAIAEHVDPSGEFQVGGQSILIFREKKLKVGDYLTITFEGADYMIEITAIEPTSFTLRLNKETLTRPINP